MSPAWAKKCPILISSWGPGGELLISHMRLEVSRLWNFAVTCFAEFAACRRIGKGLKALCKLDASKVASGEKQPRLGIYAYASPPSLCSGSEAGSYLRLIDSCITQLVPRRARI